MTESSANPRRRRRRRADGEPATEAAPGPGRHQAPASADAASLTDRPTADDSATGSTGDRLSGTAANGTAANSTAADGTASNGRAAKGAAAKGTAPARDKARGGRRRPVRQQDRQARDGERGWRDLVGNAPSQVGVSGALRARDLARPTPEDLAAAERDLPIVRRQWKPPE